VTPPPGPAPSPFDGLSVVIPAFNEERRIGATIRRIQEYAASRIGDFEVIVVDDGSADATGRVATEAGNGSSRLAVVRNPGNRGKGYSLRAGAMRARFPYVLLTDADESTPIEEIEKLAPHASLRSVVIASRGMAESRCEVRQPFYRETMGKVFNRIVQTILLPGFSDTQCGFKLFGAEVVAAVFPTLRTERFAFDVEVIARALRLGFEVREVPVRWLNDEGSSLNPIKDSAVMLRDVLRIWWLLRD